jgi:hypothetical protein
MSKDFERVYSDGKEETIAHQETRHFSGIVLEQFTTGGPRETMEIISKTRGGELNHSVVARRALGEQPFYGARDMELGMVLQELERCIRAGKTAKQALIDYNKPTLEEEELSRQAFNWFMGLRDDT